MRYYRKRRYPTRGTKKRSYRKRTYRKRYPTTRKKYSKYKKPRTAPVVQFDKGIEPPDVMYKKFLWYENNFQFHLNGYPESGTVTYNTSYNISLNNPARPIPGSGAFKMANYFDWYLGGLYRRCRTYAAKITVRIRDFYWTDGDTTFQHNAHPVQLCLIIDPARNASNIDYTNLEEIMSLPSNICIKAKAFPNRVGSTLYLSSFIRIHDMFKMTKHQYDNIVPGPSNAADLYDNVGYGGILDPTQLATCVIWMGRVITTPSTTIPDLVCHGDMRVKFYTKLWDRIEYGEVATT